MLGQAGRRSLKSALSVARVKLLYSRITLTRFTTFYFFFALIACVILSALQAVSFVDNSVAVLTVSPFIKNVSMDSIIILDKQNLQTCTSIPNQPGTTCTIRLNFAGNLSTRDVSESAKWIQHEELDAEDTDDDAGPFADISSGIPSMPAIGLSLMDENCIISLAWLGEFIEDGKREDVVTILFQIWLFSLALIAILNESIPHLGAACLGQALRTGWAGYSINSIQSLTKLYRNVILPEACGGVDVMGNWWDVRLQHLAPIFIFNAVTSVAFVYLSAKLYKVYNNQSFSRVGASPAIHRIYKIALFFLVCIQLSGFFSLVSIVLWIDKICRNSMEKLATDFVLYLAAFITILVFQFPGLCFGWFGVRKECKVQFACFYVLSVFLLAISTAMFFTPLYRYIFTTWAFFATATVTAYIFIVATNVLGVICRLNFGKGLAHYLQVTEALEGVDFTPVSFATGYDSDPEKFDYEELKGSTRASLKPIILQLPTSSFQDPEKRLTRGSSLYFESNGNTTLLSASPPLVSELGPPPGLSKAPSQRRSVYTPSLHSLRYYPQSEAETNSRTIHPRPSIKLNSGESRDVLSSPPLRFSSVRASPTLQKYGLPANPRVGRQNGG